MGGGQAMLHFSLEQSELNNRYDRHMGVSRKVVKGLLLNAERKSHRVGDRCALHTISSDRPRFTDIRNEKSRINAIVGMEGLAPRPGPARTHRPVLIDSCIDAAPGPEGLRNGKLLPFHSPGAQVFSCGRNSNVVSESSFDAGVSAGGVVLVNRRAEKKIASIVSSQERGLTPRPPH